MKLQPSLSVDFNCSRIADLLYLGGKELSGNQGMMQSMNITHIINTCVEAPCHFPTAFKYLECHLKDSADEIIRPRFEEAFAFIDDAANAGSATLVHCSVGMSRSATLVIAYIMQKEKKRLAEAIAEVKEHRPVSAPNVGALIKRAT